MTELADTLIDMRRPAKARRWLDRALSIQPADPSTVARKARSYLAEGNLDAAGQLLDPLPPQLENGVAFAIQESYRELRRDWGWIISAVRQMRNAPGFQLDAWTGGYYAELGWAQRRSGDEAGAQETFKEGREKLEALRAKVSDNGYVAVRISEIEAGLGNCDAALREAQTAVDAAGEDRYGGSYHVANLASTQALCGRKEAALATLSRIAQGPISIPLASLRAAADWDSLRDDPRFQKLIADAEVAVKAQPGK
jgi:predicted Zn-dependent protease